MHVVDEAQQTVQKRLEFIRGEKEKIESKIQTKETSGQEISRKIQQMQSQLQQLTTQAIQAIKDQHQAGR